MLTSIKVYGEAGGRELIFEREFKKEEGNKVRSFCGQEQNQGFSRAYAIFVVGRITPGREFLKDLFFPGFFNSISKTDTLFQKMAMGFIEIVGSLATLGIRIATLPFRFIYQGFDRKENHPFYQYLISQGVGERELAKGYVYLDKIEKEETDELDEFTRETVKFHFTALPLFEDSVIRKGRESIKKGGIPLLIKSW